MIDGINFSTIEAEKYWDFPKSYKGDKKIEIRNLILSNQYIGAIKKDGYYYRYVNDATNDYPELLSRNISKITNRFTDKIGHVPHIARTLAKLPSGTVLLGEIHFNDLSKTSSDVTTIMGCKQEKAIARQEAGDKLYYYIFDVWAYNGQSLMDMPIEKRIEILDYQIRPLVKSNPYIQCANYKIGEDLLELLDAALADGEEGIVMTKMGTIPEPGKRTSRKTIKVKKEIVYSLDVFFTGKYKSATRPYTGTETETWKFWENTRTGEKIGGLLFDQYVSGEPIEPVTKSYFYGWAGSLEIGCLRGDTIHVIGYLSGLKDEFKQMITEPNNQLIMCPCQVTAMQFTKDNMLRHAKFEKFREDLTYKDCEYSKIFG